MPRRFLTPVLLAMALGFGCAPAIAADENQGDEMTRDTGAADAARTALERQARLWRPEHSPAALEWLRNYRQEVGDEPVDPARFVGEPSGLSHRDIHTIINDRSLAGRFFEVHSDMLDPEKSTYVDPIFGALHGQRAIRAWLVPIMSGAAGNASFDPVFPADFLDDGKGGTSVDEWRLVQLVDGKWIEGVRGVSVRRYRDGWIRDAVDFFDTTPIRMGVAAAVERGEKVMPLPDWPRVPTERWVPERAVVLSEAAREWLGKGAPAPVGPSTGLTNRDLHDLVIARDARPEYYAEISALFHPTASVYVDPIFGELHGRDDIHAWLADIMPKTGNIAFEMVQEPVFDEDMSYTEWRQVAVLPDGSRVEMTRGASIRRYRDGWIVYAADYFDTAPFLDPAIQAASEKAGSSITLDDIRRYRDDIPAPDAAEGMVTDILGLTGASAVTATPESPISGESRKLRDRLVDLALEEVDRSGSASVSIRKVSRAANISHNTPYNHFASKQDLLVAVAARGFWMLHDRMAGSVRGEADPGNRHRTLGVEFVRFALQHPGVFRLMTSSEIADAAQVRELTVARVAVAQLFGTTILDLTNRRDGAFLDPKVTALAGWALVQGLSTLMIEKQFVPGLLGLASNEDVARAVTDMFTGLIVGD